MRVLFDQGTPAPLPRLPVQHEVSTAYEQDWSRLKNGELLSAAELAGFEVFVTTDTNLRYQQNLATRTIAIVVLGTTSWPRIKAEADSVVTAIDASTEGSYIEVSISY
jgi:hypothetical protein